MTAHNNAALCLASFDNLQVLPLPLPSPALNLNPNGSQLSLSWPGWATGYAPYSASNLLWPVQWQLLTNIPQTNSGRLILPLPPTHDQQFFRLALP